ncbi:MAG TPA: ATP-binding protein [Stellaceae bacterium]|nr:ATP-binding protein [Stellaceae bacterium]
MAWSGGRDTTIAYVSRASAALLGRAKRALGRQRKAWQRRTASWRTRADGALRRLAETPAARTLGARTRRVKTVLAQARKSSALAAKRSAAALSRSHTAWISGITSALALTLTALFIWMSWHSRHIVLSDTYISSSNLSLSVEQFVAHTVDSVDKSLTAAIDDVNANGASPDRPRAGLAERVRRTPEVTGLIIVDAAGRVRSSSMPLAKRAQNAADKRYFALARGTAGIWLAVNEPLAARAHSGHVIVASRRFNRPDGSFGGVVAATINPDYMQRFFSTLTVGDHGVIALQALDGTLLMQRPQIESDVGRNYGSSVLFKGMLPWASSGVFPMQYERDGLWRIVGYQRVERLPLVVQVALAEDEALANWRHTTVFQAIVVFFMLGVLGLMAVVLHRQLDARLVANRKLRATVGELERARVAAEASSRVKSQFLANMSHELRTPLNAIIGFSEMIRDAIMGPVATRYREYAHDIHNCGRLLLGVISDVLDLSKVEVGRLELHDEQVDLAKVIGDCHRLISERVKAGRLELAIDLPSDLPMLLGDELRLKQIVLNLLSNSVKFTPAGGRVTFSAAVARDGSLALAVSDTGIGMKAEEIPIALEPFRQIDSVHTRRYEGTGLGLPLARTLAELHGGTLLIESVPDRGTTVTVTLPPERLIARGKFPVIRLSGGEIGAAPPSHMGGAPHAG